MAHCFECKRACPKPWLVVGGRIVCQECVYYLDRNMVPPHSKKVVT